MKSRVEIKERAKAIVKDNYSVVLIATVLYALVGVALSTVTAGLGSILILPLEAGLSLVFVRLWMGETASFELMFTSALQENYLRKLGGMLLQRLYIFLWSLLFVIPGIVKSYSYFAAPYILAKYPGVPADSALKLSMRIMDGHKMDLFITDLSFIGWFLLGSLTFGILNLFYVNPYLLTTHAGCFEEYLADAVENGRVDVSELVG